MTNEHQHYEEYHEQEFNNFGFQEPHQFEDHQFDQGHGLPEYTEEENEYYRYMLNKSEKGGIVGGIINAVSGIRSWGKDNLLIESALLFNLWRRIHKATC